MRRLPFADLGRVPRACSLALVASLALLLVTPGLSAADTGPAPNAPYGVGAQFPSGRYGATQVPVTVTWHMPDAGVRPDSYWVKAALASTGAWQSCYTHANYYDGPTFSCTLDSAFQTGEQYFIYVYAGILYPANSGTLYGPPAELTYTPIAPPGPVRRTAAQPISYAGPEASVAVSWIPPGYNGGGGVDEYRVNTLGPVTCTTTTLTCTLEPMGAGLSDKITVYAHNAGGWGAPNTFDYTVPAQATPTPKPVQPAPTPKPVQPGQPTSGSSPAPAAEASLASPAPGVQSQAPSQAPAQAASAASTVSIAPTASPNANFDRSTNGSSGGATGDGGPPYWLLALLGVGLIGVMIVAVLVARGRLRPSSGQSPGGSESQ